MEGMEEKLGAILGNPQMMQQIMSMAQALGNPPPERPHPQPQGIDPAMIQKMASVIQGSGIDQNQRTLLKALDPYLSRDRICQLERAMRAAKLANLAAGLLGGGSHV